MNRLFSIRKTICVASMMFALCFAPVRPTKADADVYEKTLKASAWVISKHDCGTGILVDAQRRWVLTNHHVVGNERWVIIFFPDYENKVAVAEPEHYLKKIAAMPPAGEVIAADPTRDLAIVQLPALPAACQAISLAKASARPGETVHAIGNSGIAEEGNDVVGVLWRYSKGEVRQVYSRKMLGDFQARVVETQVPCNHGDSGGPVVNDRGELVAVTMAMQVNERLVSYAVDLSEVRKMLAEAKAGAWAKKAPVKAGPEKANVLPEIP